MKRVVFDYLRRKAWILAPGGAAVLALVVCQALWPRQTAGANLNGLLYQFAFLMAALPLSLELQQGAMRVTFLLPIDARRLGRAWWWAGVGAPAALISLLLLLGAVVQLLVHPDIPVRWDARAITIATLWLWLGAAFTVLFNLGAGPARDWRQQTKNIGGGVAWGLMAGGGFMLLRWAEASVVAQILLLTIGVALAVIGWLRADNLVLARAGLRIAASSGAAPPSASPVPTRKSYGGLAYLVTRTCLRAIAGGIAILVISPLVMIVMREKNWRGALQAGATPYWFIFLLALLPVLAQLRFLRTLPLSAGRLALVLLAMFWIPCLVVGATSSLLAKFVSGPDVALLVGQRNFFAATALSLAIPLALWRGLGRGSYALLITLIIILQTAPVFLGSSLGRHLPSASVLALLAPALAFWLARLALERGGKAYRASPASFTTAWGGAR